MHKRNRLFVSIALVYGLLGGLIAIVRLLDPSLIPGNVPRAHGHIMLLGFVLMMIYGIALHVLPRFGGFPLYSERMADWQLYAANTGLPLMIAGWLGWRDMLVMTGGLFTYAAIVLFGLNMILTVRENPVTENIAEAQRQAHSRMAQMGLTFSRVNRSFITAAQGYLMLAGIGLLINGSLLADGASRPAFLHLFTLGFILFMIYGLGSHMLPRFTGNPIREGAWAWLQMGLAHAGVAGYVVGYLAGWHGLVIMGAALAWLSLAVFTFRAWPVLWPKAR